MRNCYLERADICSVMRLLLQWSSFSRVKQVQVESWRISFRGLAVAMSFDAEDRQGGRPWFPTGGPPAA